MIILNLLNKIVLELVNTLYENNDHSSLMALGLRPDDARIITEMTPKERLYILEKGINLVNTQIDMTALIESIHRCQERQSYEQVEHDAILLGATRHIMHQYAKMSAKQFTNLRSKLGVETKSCRLNDDQIQMLTTVIESSFTQKHDITLGYLVDLAKKTGLPIGSIHSYLVTVWGEKHDLRQ